MLTVADWQRIQDLFHAAVDLPPSEQVEFLHSACGEDRDLLRHVRSLIFSVHGDGLESAIGHAAASVDDGELGLEPGARIGPWVIVRLLGEGGMGRVYLAERADDEYRKQVALKMLPLGVRVPGLLARFRAERQILASLEHPNIARMLEGGTTADGSPFVAMEYVDGIPIDTYCADTQCSVRRKLELFRQVCAAVQYAHQNLIVHRDIKPGNILVNREGVPKLLDFGIAKLTSAGFAPLDGPALTSAAERILTPEYASPEQLEGKPVTTSSDVYSLGVLLFELLTATRMHTNRRSADSEPPRAGEVAPRELRRTLSGDLENIVRKAICLEPERRYATAGQFSDDIDRYLQGFPVLAQPDSWRYRSRKFLARNKALVAFSLVFLLSVVGFAIGMGVLARRARTEADNARAVSAFLVDIFRVAKPSESRGRAITAQEILERGAERIRSEMKDRPEVQATLMSAIGEVYLDLGLNSNAGPMLQDALQIRERLSGPESLEAAELLVSLAAWYDNRSAFSQSEKCLRRALAIRERRLPRGDILIGEMWNEIGLNLYYQARYPEAEQAHRQALENFRANHHEANTETSLNNLAITLLELGRYADAEKTHREIIERRKKRLGEDHPLTLTSMNNLAFVLETLGRPKEQTALLWRVLELRRKVHGESHPLTGSSWMHYGMARAMTGDQAEGIRCLTRALELRKQRSDPDDADMALNKFLLADLVLEAGDVAAAKKLSDEAYASLQRRPMAARMPACLMVMARVAWASGQKEMALRRWEEALEKWKTVPGKGQLGRASVLISRAEKWSDGRDSAAVVGDLEEALRIRSAALPTDHPLVAQSRSALGRALLQSGRNSEGLTLLQEAVEVLRRKVPNHRETVLALAALESETARR
jgi:tetratricopeptide (TPR) repeat protein